MTTQLPVRRTRIAILVWCLYVALCAILTAYHEPWRDEVQAWSIARESGTLSALFRNKAYEGHPGLWFFILFLAGKVASGFWIVQAIHLAIACVSGWILIRKFPAPLIIRALLLFGYFFVFEYTVIARSYGLAVMLILLFGSVRAQNRDLLAAIMCALLLQTNFHGSVLGCCLWLIYVWQRWPAREKLFWVANGVVVLGFLMFLFSVKTPPDHVFSPGMHVDMEHLVKAVQSLSAVFLPLPGNSAHFWNTSFIDAAGPDAAPVVKGILSAVIYLLCLVSLFPSRKALAFFIGATVILLTFFAVKYQGFLRHEGFLFISWVAAYWIRQEAQFACIFSGKTIGRIFTGMLVAHVLAAGMAAYYELTLPFSDAQHAAGLIRKEGNNRYLIATDDVHASGVAGLLKKQMYYANIDTMGSFVVWNERRTVPLSDDSLSVRIERQLAQHPDAWLLVHFEINEQQLHQLSHLRLVKRFPPTIVRDEQLYIYQR